MSGWTEQELIYEAAFQYEWGYSSELEKAAKDCIDRIKATAWDEGHAAGMDEGHGATIIETNPYREGA